MIKIKTRWALTTIFVVFSPFLTIACSSNHIKDNDDNDSKNNFEEKFEQLPKFSVKDQEFIPEKSGLYLVKGANNYQGEFWHGNRFDGTRILGTDIVALKEDRAFSNISLFDHNDAFYLIYGHDIANPYPVKSFLQNLFLIDTMALESQELFTLNLANNYQLDKNKLKSSTHIPFTANQNNPLQGAISHYYGKQSKLKKTENWHQKFQQFIEHEQNEDVVTTIANYYNVEKVPNENGQFCDKAPREDIVGHKGWYPISARESLFTYEISHSNAVKIIYKNGLSQDSIDAQFAFVDHDQVKTFSPIIGGSTRHDDFLNHPQENYRYRALKNHQFLSEKSGNFGDQIILEDKKDVEWLSQQLILDNRFKNFKLNDIVGEKFTINHKKTDRRSSFTLQYESDVYHLEIVQDDWIIKKNNEKTVGKIYEYVVILLE